jgi:iron(II)-dependent oxidoreductase
MALTPAGDVPLTVCYPVATQSGFDFAADSSAPVPVEAFYIDRFAVTNAEYAEFINDGGYSSVELWPSEILAQVLQFVDQTGQSGPRGWSHGRPPEGKADHPVVGICWYEAKAYARWAGKRLPTPAQWQQAGCWRTNESGHGKMLRYPWGNAFDPVKANIWSSGHRGTVPVDAYRQGCTPNGIYQLVGNVWEWVDADFEIRAGSEGIRVAMEQPMAEIRGGAFDTYFDAQATCQFRSGQIALHRTANVGFRCCVAVELLRVPPDPSAFLQEDLP